MTPQFHTRLQADIDGGLPYTLLGPLVYASAVLDRIVTVPTGFKTDLASVPRPLWSVLPPMGGYSDPAVVHDFLYATNGVTRTQADSVLNEAMSICQVSRWARWTIYAGVRVGGWRPWNAYRAKEAV